MTAQLDLLYHYFFDNYANVKLDENITKLDTTIQDNEHYYLQSREDAC